LVPLIEAGRRAPSAVNAQPWRFLWRDPQLYLFVTRNNAKYVLKANEPYCLHDGGICMANVALALEALGLSGQWTLLEGTEPDLPAHPSNLHPLAVLPVSGV
jgi:nitroreductase